MGLSGAVIVAGQPVLGTLDVETPSLGLEQDIFVVVLL